MLGSVLFAIESHSPGRARNMVTSPGADFGRCDTRWKKVVCELFYQRPSTRPTNALRHGTKKVKCFVIIDRNLLFHRDPEDRRPRREDFPLGDI